MGGRKLPACGGRVLGHISAEAQRESVNTKKNKMAPREIVLSHADVPCCCCEQLALEPCVLPCGHILCSNCVPANWPHPQYDAEKFDPKTPDRLLVSMVCPSLREDCPMTYNVKPQVCPKLSGFVNEYLKSLKPRETRTLEFDEKADHNTEPDLLCDGCQRPLAFARVGQCGHALCYQCYEKKPGLIHECHECGISLIFNSRTCRVWQALLGKFYPEEMQELAEARDRVKAVNKEVMRKLRGSGNLRVWEMDDNHPFVKSSLDSTGVPHANLIFAAMRKSFQDAVGYDEAGNPLPLVGDNILPNYKWPARCNGCKAWLVGRNYRCKEPACWKADFCDRCVALHRELRKDYDMVHCMFPYGWQNKEAEHLLAHELEERAQSLNTLMIIGNFLQSTDHPEIRATAREGNDGPEEMEEFADSMNEDGSVDLAKAFAMQEKRHKRAGHYPDNCRQ